MIRVGFGVYTITTYSGPIMHPCQYIAKIVIITQLIELISVVNLLFALGIWI